MILFDEMESNIKKNLLCVTKLNEVLGKFCFALCMCAYWVQCISWGYNRRFRKPALCTVQKPFGALQLPSDPGWSVSSLPGGLKSLVPKITASGNPGENVKAAVLCKENSRPRLRSPGYLWEGSIPGWRKDKE